MGIIKSVFILLVGAALATFLWSNYDQTVVISFLNQKTIPLSLSAALVLALVVGFLLAVTLSIPNQLRLRGRARELQKQNSKLQGEIAELRKLPLTDVSEPMADSPSDSSSDASKTVL